MPLKTDDHPEDFLDDLDTDDLDESLEDKYQTVVDDLARQAKYLLGAQIDVDHNLFQIGLHVIEDGIRVLQSSIDDADYH